jgi:hypothetical protein
MTLMLELETYDEYCSKLSIHSCYDASHNATSRQTTPANWTSFWNRCSAASSHAGQPPAYFPTAASPDQRARSTRFF